MTSRYINPYTDFGFKKLFGEEASKDLLIDFLNSILPEQYQVADLTLHPTELLPDNPVFRKAIVDIACTTPNGDKFIVEMQKEKQRWFKDRALFYASAVIQRQKTKGNWDFKMNPVFFVAILDFEYDEHEERREIQRMVSLKDQNGATFSETLQMIFLQMPLFNKTEAELQTKKDKWLFFLKNLESFDDIPAILREPVFEQAFEVAEWIKYPLPLQDAYWASQKVYWDNINTFNYAIETAEERGEAKGMERGIAKGMERGIAKGMERGMERGIAKGREEGREEGKKTGRSERDTEIASNMKQKGLTPALIAELTGLSVDEIERL